MNLRENQLGKQLYLSQKISLELMHLQHFSPSEFSNF